MEPIQPLQERYIWNLDAEQLDTALVVLVYKNNKLVNRIRFV